MLLGLNRRDGVPLEDKLLEGEKTLVILLNASEDDIRVLDGSICGEHNDFNPVSILLVTYGPSFNLELKPCKLFRDPKLFCPIIIDDGPCFGPNIFSFILQSDDSLLFEDCIFIYLATDLICFKSDS